MTTEIQPLPEASSGHSGGIRRVNEAEIRRYNTLVGLNREFAFTWAGKPARLRFLDSAQAIRPKGWLRIRLGDHGYDIGLPALPEPSSLGADFAGIEIAQLPESLLLGVLEVWLEEPVAALQHHNISLQVEGWQANDAPLTAPYAWEIARGDQDRFLAGTIHADVDALTYLANLANRAQPVPRHAADTVPFPVSIAIGHVPLSLEATAALEPGDVVLLPTSPANWAQGQCELWAGERLLARAVKQQLNVKISSMNPSSETKPAPTQGAQKIDHLPVQLVFDVGQIHLSVAQLRTLNEGYTFELPGAAGQIVTIRANGREVGHGELVELGEKLGVRIVDWSLA